MARILSLLEIHQKNELLLDVNIDLALTAGGITLLELACVGVPCLIICGKKFEIETANLLEKNNFGINLGFGKNLSLTKIAKNIDQFQKISHKEKK